MCFLMIQVIFTDVDYNFVLKAEKFLDMRGNVDLKQNMRLTHETLKCVHLLYTLHRYLIFLIHVNFY